MTGPCPDDRATVALAFANTSDDGYEDAADATDALEAWLVDQGLVSPRIQVSSAELSRFGLLRDAVRDVLAARVDGEVPDGSSLRILEAAALAAPGTPIGVWSADGSVARGWRSTGGDPLDVAAATLAADVVDLVCDAGERITRGDGATCRFLIASPGD